MESIFTSIANRAAEDILGIVVELLIVCIIPFIGLKIREFFHEKTALIKDEQLRAGVEYAFKRLEETAKTVAVEISQTIKRRGIDGKVINPDVLVRTAVNRVYRRVDPKAREVLADVLGGEKLDELVRSKVEGYAKAGG